MELFHSADEEIQRLRARMPDAPKGSPEAALACFDLWTDPADAEEAKRLLAEVEAERERHLLPIGDKQP
ncbi:MAG: hypothetical protein NZM28_07750 [Fimbriimonadales bacterium]|nr:hypothetical protein [Fimbriimonadales bacterium]